MASPHTEGSEDRRMLVSWKEIAVFLNHSESTVKRWERERGLPVHRVPGGEVGSVFAYRDELEDWLKGKPDEGAGGNPAAGGAGAAGESGAPVGAAPALAGRQRRSAGLARIAAWVAPLGLTAALVFYLWGGHSHSRATAVDNREQSNAGAPELTPNSVAVLPFINAGGDAGSDYLSDGITESLIGSLARIPQIKVRSRDSVFRLKGTGIGVQEAGNELGVPDVVSGRMKVDGDNIEISAELTDVHDDNEIWGRRYTGRSADLIQLQEQMAGDIAEKLLTTLSTADKQLVARQGTENIEAYTLYLKGRYAWNLRDRANLQAAVAYFEKAIANDPNYALAFAGLADVYSVLPFFGGNPADEFPKAGNAARKALELDPTLAHPHAILGSIEMEYFWDFAGGEDEFKKAIALDPNDATAHQWFAENLGMLGGREQEALKEIDLAHLLDPTSLIIRRVKGSVLVAARRYDDALAVCEQLLKENPTFNLAHDCLGYAYWGKRMYPEVVEHWKVFWRGTGYRDDAELSEAMERGFGSGGWSGALTETIKAMLHQRQTSYRSPYQIARLYADLGDKEKAFEWLDTAYQEHDFLLKELNTAFELDNLRSDPRYAELVRKVGLPRLQ